MLTYVSRGSELIFEYLRRFHFARASGVLDLSDMGLTYLPADVMRFYKTHGVQVYTLAYADVC
jgi:hypothetical protein